VRHDVSLYRKIVGKARVAREKASYVQLDGRCSDWKIFSLSSSLRSLCFSSKGLLSECSHPVTIIDAAVNKPDMTLSVELQKRSDRHQPPAPDRTFRDNACIPYHHQKVYNGGEPTWPVFPNRDWTAAHFDCLSETRPSACPFS
jgi:hypothetical protein